MLTVHDHTFELKVSGWGQQTPHAMRIAEATLLSLLNKSPEEIRRIARSKRALASWSAGARLLLRNYLARKGKVVSHAGVIELGSIECPKE